MSRQFAPYRSRFVPDVFVWHSNTSLVSSIKKWHCRTAACKEVKPNGNLSTGRCRSQLRGVKVFVRRNTPDAACFFFCCFFSRGKEHELHSPERKWKMFFFQICDRVKKLEATGVLELRTQTQTLSLSLSVSLCLSLSLSVSVSLSLSQRRVVAPSQNKHTRVCFVALEFCSGKTRHTDVWVRRWWRKGTNTNWWPDAISTTVAITESAVCAGIVVEMGSDLTKRGSCWISQLLSWPKVSRSNCVISQEPFIVQCENPLRTVAHVERRSGECFALVKKQRTNRFRTQ